MRKTLRGFTLIELLIVIAIIAILAAVVFVALDPLTRFQDARDSRRWSDVTEMLSAVKINQVDNRGSYLAAIASTTAGTPYLIGTGASCSSCTAVTTTACVDLTNLVTLGYMGAIPADPSGGTAAATKYYLTRASTGVITIGACAPEHTATGISVTR